MSREKGMIKRAALREKTDAVDAADAAIIAAFPATGFPLPFPTAELLYDVVPVPLAGGGTSATVTLQDKDNGAGGTVWGDYFAEWDAGWLADLVNALSGWASFALTELTNAGAFNVEGVFLPFGSGNAGFDRSKWFAGSMDREAAEAGALQSGKLAILDSIGAITSGRTILGFTFPDFQFLTTTTPTLEDGFLHDVGTWTAGNPTEWESKAIAAKAAADAILASWVAVPAGADLASAFRFWREGSQTKGRGE